MRGVFRVRGTPAARTVNLPATKARVDRAGHAHVYAFCGDADKAFKWLDKALAYQDPGLGEIVTQNLFDKIHSDPRWLPFLRKIGKAPDQLAKIEFKMPPLPQDK